MRTFAVRFKSVRWNGIQDRLPMIPVRLSWGERNIRTQMLLDSGSNGTFLERWVAEYLRLPLSSVPTQARGATGTMAVVHTEVDFRIAKRTTTGEEDEAWRLAPVAVAAGAHDPLPYSVLGRRPFMLRYEITFREADEVVILRELPLSKRGGGL